MKNAIFMRATSTNDYQELPAGILVEITKGLRTQINKMRKACIDNGIDLAKTYWNFATPVTCTKRLEAKVQRLECERVDFADFDEIEDIAGARGQAVVVTDGMIWFDYYCKYSGAVVESEAMTITSFKELAGWKKPAAKGRKAK